MYRVNHLNNWNDTEFFYSSLSWMKPISRERAFHGALSFVYKNDHKERRGDKFIETIENFKLNRCNRVKFNEVLEEIKELKRKKDAPLKERINSILETIENGTIMPFSTVLDRQIDSNLYIEFISDIKVNKSERPDASWTMKVLEEHSNDFANLMFRHIEPVKIEYDSRLDATGSLLYAIDRIIKGAHNRGGTMRHDDKCALHDVITSLTAAVNKISSELSESYLRGARAARKCESRIYA